MVFLKLVVIVFPLCLKILSERKSFKGENTADGKSPRRNDILLGARKDLLSIVRIYSPIGPERVLGS
jgi:hypothetical protein